MPPLIPTTNLNSPSKGNKSKHEIPEFQDLWISGFAAADTYNFSRLLREFDVRMEEERILVLERILEEGNSLQKGKAKEKGRKRKEATTGKVSKAFIATKSGTSTTSYSNDKHPFGRGSSSKFPPPRFSTLAQSPSTIPTTSSRLFQSSKVRTPLHLEISDSSDEELPPIKFSRTNATHTSPRKTGALFIDISSEDEGEDDMVLIVETTTKGKEVRGKGKRKEESSGERREGKGLGSKN